MTKKEKIGDPFEQIVEQVVTTGRIGGKEPKKEREADNSISSDFQTSKLPEAKKSGKSGRKQHTIYLPPYLSRWLKVYAAENDQEISEIVAAALESYKNSLEG